MANLNGWISVQDKLPDVHVNVLTMSINSKTTNDPHDMKTGCFLGFGEWGVKSEYKRTHWMLLPTPLGEITDIDTKNKLIMKHKNILLLLLAVLHLVPLLIVFWLTLFELIAITSNQFGSALVLACVGILIILLIE